MRQRRHAAAVRHARHQRGANEVQARLCVVRAPAVRHRPPSGSQVFAAAVRLVGCARGRAHAAAAPRRSAPPPTHRQTHATTLPHSRLRAPARPAPRHRWRRWASGAPPLLGGGTASAPNTTCAPWMPRRTPRASLGADLPSAAKHCGALYLVASWSGEDGVWMPAAGAGRQRGRRHPLRRRACRGRCAGCEAWARQWLRAPRQHGCRRCTGGVATDVSHHCVVPWTTGGAALLTQNSVRWQRVGARARRQCRRRRAAAGALDANR